MMGINDLNYFSISFDSVVGTQVYHLGVIFCTLFSLVAKLNIWQNCGLNNEVVVHLQV